MAETAPDPKRTDVPAGLIPRETIVLVGLMGVGKTTVGRRLANCLGIPFVDADAEIEKAAGCEISSIFKSYGEAAFREGEKKVICRLLSDPPHVLATGGGAFMNDTTREAIKDRATSVWLDADIDTLVERTGRKNTRPLLANGDPKEILTNLANERNPIYAEADIRVLSGTGPHEEVVNAVLAALADHWRDEA